jgi:hypothetical protein
MHSVAVAVAEVPMLKELTHLAVLQQLCMPQLAVLVQAELVQQDQELLLVDLTVAVTDSGLAIQPTRVTHHQAAVVELISVLAVAPLETASLLLAVVAVKVVAVVAMVSSQPAVMVHQH